MTTSIGVGLVLLAGLSISAKPEEQPLGALIDKVIEAYGGKTALESVNTVRQVGKVASTMRGGAVGHMERVFQRPDRLRVEISYPGEAKEVRLSNGTTCWRDGKEVSGPPKDAVVLQVARMALPLSLLEHKGELKDLGTVERDGKKLRAVELPLPGGLSVVAEIDPATGHILRSVGQGMMGMLQFSADYSDFRKVGGVLYAFGEKTVAMGKHTGDTTLEKIEPLKQAPAGVFTGP